MVGLGCDFGGTLGEPGQEVGWYLARLELHGLPVEVNQRTTNHREAALILFRPLLALAGGSLRRNSGILRRRLGER